MSAVTSAFIIQVNSQLQPDSGGETTALLRVLIHKIDNTTFENVPTPPQWNGPSRTTVLAQAFLVTSLAASLFSAFLAVLGKQWLGRYESTDLRETVVERGQNRQQKLDSIVTWRFHRVMQSLPLMLQVALFFLGYAVPLSLVDVNTAISSIAFCLTSVGVLFHISTIVAGAAFKSCPYQTAASHFLRYLRPKFPGVVHSIETDSPLRVLSRSRAVKGPLQPTVDLQCVSWVLWTSLDKTIHLSTLQYLSSIPELHGIDPTFVLNCFYIFASCVSLHDNTVLVTRGWEQLAAVSAQCFLRILDYLQITEHWTSRTMEDLRRRYNRVFPFPTDFSGLPIHSTMILIDALLNGKYDRTSGWDNYKPKIGEDSIFSWYMAQAAKGEYQQHQNVPDWVLRFVSHSLSLDPPPGARVVFSCLKIAAIGLGCDISAITDIGDRYVYIV